MTMTMTMAQTEADGVLDIVDGHPTDWVLDPYTGLLGEPVLGMVLGGLIVLSFWVYSDDLAMPAVILFIISGSILSVLPGQAVNVARGFIVIAVVAAIMAVVRRYVL